MAQQPLARRERGERVADRVRPADVAQEWPHRPRALGVEALLADGRGRYADGVLHHIFSDLKATNRFYVELGTSNASQSISRRLRQVCGWTGLLLDAAHEDASINLQRARATRENVVELLDKHHVPREPDLLTIDLGGPDFHVLAELLRDRLYRPRVLLVATAFALGEHVDMVRVYHPASSASSATRDAHGCYSSASTLAFSRLASWHQYTVVAAVSPFLVWVRDDALRSGHKLHHYTHANDVGALRAEALATARNHSRASGRSLKAVSAPPLSSLGDAEQQQQALCTRTFGTLGFQTSEEVIHRAKGAPEAPMYKIA